MPTLQDFLLAFEQSKDAVSLIVTQGDPTQFALPEMRGGLVQTSLSDETSSDDLVSLIADCARRGRWCRVDVLTADIPPAVYQALRLLAATGHLQYLKDGEVVDVPLAPGAKILCVVASETLDRISIPTFLNLFGIVHRE